MVSLRPGIDRTGESMTWPTCSEIWLFKLPGGRAPGRMARTTPGASPLWSAKPSSPPRCAAYPSPYVDHRLRPRNLCRQLVPARSDPLVRCRSSSFLTLRMACSSREEATNGPRLPESRCTPWSQQQRNTATLVIQCLHHERATTAATRRGTVLWLRFRGPHPDAGVLGPDRLRGAVRGRAVVRRIGVPGPALGRHRPLVHAAR